MLVFLSNAHVFWFSPEGWNISTFRVASSHGKWWPQRVTCGVESDNDFGFNLRFCTSNFYPDVPCITILDLYIYIYYIYTLYIIYHIVRSLVSQLTVLTIGYSHQNHHPHHSYVSGSHCSEPEPATILAEAVPGTKPYGGPKPWPTAPAESNPADPAMVRMWSPTS